MHDTTVVQPRRCPTLKDAEEKNTMDKSKERVKSKNLIDGGLQDILSDMDDGFMDLEESNSNRFQLVSCKKKIEEKRITRYFFW